MRRAHQGDLEAIVAIYNATVHSRMATADTEPVSMASRQAWFDNHTDTRPVLVEERHGEIAGWLSFEPFYGGRPAYHRTAELSIYIHEPYRGQGVGAHMLHHAIETAPRLGVDILLATIFSHNTASLRLFEKFGFARWGELPDVAEMDGARYSVAIHGLNLDAGHGSPGSC
jgi:phosphinothricin acetyltransferase